MKYILERTAIPAFLCFLGLMFYSEQIEAFSNVIYYGMILMMFVGLLGGEIQSRSKRDANIVQKAIAEFKKERGIAN